ncbi:MAG: phosphate acyltransferase PlsX, partial [Firmicutes bacterium]|nr:phosphate acyltransferase PlsX [Bacillota bacterium]
ALNILKDGFADAFVSAGSTGALLAGGLLICGRIKGIERPAICSLYPSLNGRVSLLVDAGANAECKPRNLCEFGLMGSIYMEQVLGRENPKVALANIGAEAEKGTQLTKKAYELLSESGLNFTGNIEARDIPAGACDVIVADGFTGNIILKLTEGMFGQMVGLMKQKLPKEMLAALASRTDYSEYGGAPILGITRPVIKMHGSSGPKAVMNAVLKASEFAKQNVVGLIEANIK